MSDVISRLPLALSPKLYQNTPPLKAISASGDSEVQTWEFTMLIVSLESAMDGSNSNPAGHDTEAECQSPLLVFHLSITLLINHTFRSTRLVNVHPRHLVSILLSHLGVEMILFSVWPWSWPETASRRFRFCLVPSSPLPRTSFLCHLSKAGVTLTVPQSAPFIYAWRLLALYTVVKVLLKWGNGSE